MKKLFFNSKMYLAIMLASSMILLSSECNPCDDIICEQGHQENCVCVCDSGWVGASCQDEIVPSKIFIKSVDVTRMPEKNGVNTWDFAAGEQNPDLMLILWRDDDYPNMAWETGISGASFGGTKMNRDPLLTSIFTYQGTGEGSLNFPERKYRLSLYDDDGDIGAFDNDDDLMGEIIFTPYQTGQQFPNLIILSNSAVTFEIIVEYQW